MASIVLDEAANEFRGAENEDLMDIREVVVAGADGSCLARSSQCDEVVVAGISRHRRNIRRVVDNVFEGSLGAPGNCDPPFLARYSTRSPLIAREITSCWICSAPSKMSKILASRCQRSTGYSRV